jgi:hypothetical protein
MNWSLVLLGIVLLIFAYFTYQWLTGSVTTAVQNTYMKTQLAPIPITNYSGPTSERCAYSFWIFINKLSSSGNTTLFTLDEPTSGTTTNTPSLLSVYIDNSANLKIALGADVYQVTDSFPLQKWERIDISFDNTTMDVYLSGKLLRSFKINANLRSTTRASINFGAIDAYISGFGRQSSPMDPSKSWSNYMAGNKTFAGAMIPSYGVTVELTKDSVSQKKMTLF